MFVIEKQMRDIVTDAPGMRPLMKGSTLQISRTPILGEEDLKRKEEEIPQISEEPTENLTEAGNPVQQPEFFPPDTEAYYREMTNPYTGCNQKKPSLEEQQQAYFQQMMMSQQQQGYQPQQVYQQQQQPFYGWQPQQVYQPQQIYQPQQVYHNGRGRNRRGKRNKVIIPKLKTESEIMAKKIIGNICERNRQGSRGHNSSKEERTEVPAKLKTASSPTLNKDAAVFTPQADFKNPVCKPDPTKEPQNSPSENTNVAETNSQASKPKGPRTWANMVGKHASVPFPI